VTVAYVGIGSNLEDPVRQVREALDELDRMPHSRVVKRSSLYRSAPVGHAAQPDFVNAVAQLETGLPAERLLAELQEIEARHGRKRSFRSRTLDWTCCTARATNPRFGDSPARTSAPVAAPGRDFLVIETRGPAKTRRSAPASALSGR
jgi:2-amino-4-hydroxy-6-hydroxymethyldihydropteridine diphosphokinase